MNQGAKMILAGPEPGVNYGKLVARAPELTAQVEQMDKTIFTMAQALFFALVDDASDPYCRCGLGHKYGLTRPHYKAADEL